MRKGQLKNGMAFLGIVIEHYVTKSVFAGILADHCWTNNIEFDARMCKTAAKNILKKGLRYKGDEGIEKHTWEGAGEEFVQPFNDAYEAACEWIDKNYPYLNQPF